MPRWFTTASGSRRSARCCRPRSTRARNSSPAASRCGSTRAAHVIGRESKYSLYDQDLVTFEEGAVAYDHRDAEGFIKLNALRLRTLAQRKKKLGL